MVRTKKSTDFISQHSFSDGLRDALKFCATFARAKTNEFVARAMIPNPKDGTATVTFVALGDKTYAVTAWHVICSFRRQALKDGVYPEGYFLPAEPGVGISPPFVRPPTPWGQKPPDVALRPIDAKLPSRIAKRSFRMESPSPDFLVRYALAAGFPTSAKELIGDRVCMTGVWAVAEGVGSSADSDQVQFYSEIPSDRLHGDISGLSGGPVFWSDGEKYGLLGFVKEAMTDAVAPGGPTKVHFICQRVDFDTFGKWAEFADKEFPRQRAELNAELGRRAQ